MRVLVFAIFVCVDGVMVNMSKGTECDPKFIRTGWDTFSIGYEMETVSLLTNGAGRHTYLKDVFALKHNDVDREKSFLRIDMDGDHYEVVSMPIPYESESGDLMYDCFKKASMTFDVWVTGFLASGKSGAKDLDAVAALLNKVTKNAITKMGADLIKDGDDNVLSGNWELTPDKGKQRLVMDKYAKVINSKTGESPKQTQVNFGFHLGSLMSAVPSGEQAKRFPKMRGTTLIVTKLLNGFSDKTESAGVFFLAIHHLMRHVTRVKDIQDKSFWEGDLLPKTDLASIFDLFTADESGFTFDEIMKFLTFEKVCKAIADGKPKQNTYYKNHPAAKAKCLATSIAHCPTGGCSAKSSNWQFQVLKSIGVDVDELKKWWILAGTVISGDLIRATSYTIGQEKVLLNNQQKMREFLGFVTYGFNKDCSIDGGWKENIYNAGFNFANNLPDRDVKVNARAVFESRSSSNNRQFEGLYAKVEATVTSMTHEKDRKPLSLKFNGGVNLLAAYSNEREDTKADPVETFNSEIATLFCPGKIPLDYGEGIRNDEEEYRKVLQILEQFKKKIHARYNLYDIRQIKRNYETGKSDLGLPAGLVKALGENQDLKGLSKDEIRSVLIKVCEHMSAKGEVQKVMPSLTETFEVLLASTETLSPNEHYRTLQSVLESLQNKNKELMTVQEKSDEEKIIEENVDAGFLIIITEQTGAAIDYNVYSKHLWRMNDDSFLKQELKLLVSSAVDVLMAPTDGWDFISQQRRDVNLLQVENMVDDGIAMCGKVEELLKSDDYRPGGDIERVFARLHDYAQETYSTNPDFMSDDEAKNFGRKLLGGKTCNKAASSYTFCEGECREKFGLNDDTICKSST